MRGFDLTGKRFGDLRARRHVETGQRGNVWECECLGCGVLVLRTAAELRRRAADGRIQSCAACARELRAGARAARNEGAKAWFLRLWGLNGDLYPATPDELDPNVGVTVHSTPTWEPEEPADRPDRSVGAQLGAYMHPIDCEGGWFCVDCGEWFGRGLGCVLCLEPVCWRCYEAEKHVRCGPARYEGMTLQAIAGEVELVSRERVRQVESRALRKLRHPLLAKELLHFLPHVEGVQLRRGPAPRWNRVVSSGFVAEPRLPRLPKKQAGGWATTPAYKEALDRAIRRAHGQYVEEPPPPPPSPPPPPPPPLPVIDEATLVRDWVHLSDLARLSALSRIAKPGIFNSALMKQAWPLGAGACVEVAKRARHPDQSPDVQKLEAKHHRWRVEDILAEVGEFIASGDW